MSLRCRQNPIYISTRGNIANCFRTCHELCINEVTMGGLVISRAACRAISACRRTSSQQHTQQHTTAQDDTLALMKVRNAAKAGEFYRKTKNRVSALVKRDKLLSNLKKLRASRNAPARSGRLPTTRWGGQDPPSLMWSRSTALRCLAQLRLQRPSTTST
jgi:hypothetical protein